MTTPLSQAQMKAALREAAGAFPAFHIAILRNIMLEPYGVALSHALMEEEREAILSFGGYDTMRQEALGLGADVLFAKAEAVLLFTYFPRLSPLLAEAFPSLSPAAVREERARVCEDLGHLFSGIRAQTKAFLLWHALEGPLFPSLGIADGFAEDQGQTGAVSYINERARALLKSIGNAQGVETSLPLMRLGADRFYDRRLWHMGRMPYSWEGCCALAHEDLKYLRPLLGRVRKCLVLDCDNTLWQGLLGEDGLGALKMGGSYPGSCFRELQSTVLELFHRGVIIALCSKNDEAQVMEALDTHPEMLLRREHIAAYRINWRHKVENIRELAEELNIGLDSLVFVDDSPLEIDLVREFLPEVRSILFSQERWLSARETLLAPGLFDAPTISAEDRQRGGLYHAEARRKQFKSASLDLESYYRSLEMTVTIAEADDFSIPRIAQLTQKTNQFNLTTRRYTEDEIRRMASSRDYSVLGLSLSDKLGDLGLVGSCILHYENGQAVFDTFLLSCRALGRRVEDVFLHSALAAAKQRGARSAIGLYKRTRKNEQVADFFPRHNFIEGPDETDNTWEYDLSGHLPAPPACFKVIFNRLALAE
jgi:FkbH-like protein